MLWSFQQSLKCRVLATSCWHLVLLFCLALQALVLNILLWWC